MDIKKRSGLGVSTQGSADESGGDTAAPVGVAGIVVRNLFGQFDYELMSERGDLSDLFIMYGDNGCGKTTLLKLLFHLLSPKRKAGHRTAIRDIPFARFEVRTVDGSAIILSRQSSLTGGYQIALSKPGQKPVTISFGTVPDREGRFAEDTEEEVFNDFLGSMGLTVYFLSADRRIQSDVLETDEDDNDEQLALFPPTGEGWRVMRAHARISRGQDQQTRSLIQAMQAASSWITSQVVQASSKGTSSSHNIYADIVRHVVAVRPEEAANPDKKKGMIEALLSLQERSTGYARFGLIPALGVDDMIAALSEASPEALNTVEKILTPYLQGTDARLQELERIYDLAKRFTEDLNTFLSRKTVDFNLRRGLSVRLPNGSTLNPEWLSSGEKHLLLLMCHVLVSNDKRSIFIIDEPELSLNVKWQRKLVSTLLDIIGKSGVQFILATHAIELLTEHSDNVVQLIPRESSPLVEDGQQQNGPTNNS